MVAQRFTKIFAAHIFGVPPTIKLMQRLQDDNISIIPVDHITDCHDMFDLVCGAKGIPADKNQRVAILSLREDRLTGRIRQFYHMPSELILADALTKPGLFKEMMFYLTTGIWRTYLVYDKKGMLKNLTLRRLEKSSSYSEEDLASQKATAVRRNSD